MKVKYLLAIFILAFSLLFHEAFAVDLEINTKQELIFPKAGVYRFSDNANEQLKSLLKQNKSVAIIISSFEGKELRIGPAAEDHQTGKKKIIKGETTLVLAFKKGSKRYGLSVSLTEPVTVGIEIQPFAGRPCPLTASCQNECGGNLGKCCEKDSGSNQSKICVQVDANSCGCANR